MKAFSTLLTAAVLAIVPISATAEVNPAIIPADARWVIYADLNALRSSVAGKELVAMAEKAQFEKSTIGLDLQKVMATVGSVTAYGSNFTSDPNAIDGTLVLQGTPDLRKIAESILLQATIASPDSVAESKELPFPSYTVKPKAHGEVAAAAVIVAFPPEPIVLVSKSRPQLLKARDAYRGSIATLARSASAPLHGLIRGSDGAFVFATSVVPSDTPFPENQPQARILKMTNSGSVAMGEKGPNSFAHVRLVATSDEMADKLQKILQGMAAMMSLAETNDKQLADFLNSAVVARDEKVVTLDLSYSSDRLAQMIRGIDVAGQTQARRPRQEYGPELVNADRIAEWQAESPQEGSDAELAWHSVENVNLKNGAVIFLGSQSNGGKKARVDRLEITPASGGAPLIFRREMMRITGRGVASIQFPGADGQYTLKIGYVNDPEGKAKYAVSIRQPKPPQPARIPESPAGKS